MGDPTAKLTDDVLVEIISRVPYKSTCSCKCVSRRWRDIISHPEHRKKLPQTLAGFFYEARISSTEKARYFINVSGEGDPLIDASLSFLPEYESLDILDCCNGLLLCRCWKPTDPETLDYVVCNPATEKWVVVPSTEWSSEVEVARLGFDPAVSSHFHVFEFIDEVAWGVETLSYYDPHIEALAIYSSKAGVWTHRRVLEDEDPLVEDEDPLNSKGVFLNGILHLAACFELVVAVDVEGKNWQFISIPDQSYFDDVPVSDIFLSQGRLHFAEGAAEWSLKHKVTNLQLFGSEYSSFRHDYSVIAFHPERGMIFMVCGSENVLMSYEMGSKKLCFIHEFGCDCYLKLDERTPYFPYIPLFSESLADEN
ncbi:hypothetical protein BRADI_2g59890v3 [Brachypodium distachyon]|uniref:F-box domain-containing protein n=1 Tax=Brachypodium distachyon TaxID=15368 RepID=A0A0Q3KJR9_BRADI|nr:hypothetical protein BRADI_2g59890v3 [Brachypodium distachyon]